MAGEVTVLWGVKPDGTEVWWTMADAWEALKALMHAGRKLEHERKEY